MNTEAIQIRQAEMADYVKMQEIYAYARLQMKQNGNPHQWGDRYPLAETILESIQQKTAYVAVQNGEICGTFVFLIWDDPTYAVIEEGAWLNDAPYGVIHRVARGEHTNGLLAAVLAFCEEKIGNLRIDTHADNHIMQHLLEKHGFVRCGIIHIADGSPRIAYQKIRQMQ